MEPEEQQLVWDDVFQEELGHVAARHEGAMPVAENLVGLAISGGGIRSATFGLGVLETLKRLGLLKQIDYLSTVSGGGYIGAWLTANCHRVAAPPGAALKGAEADGGTDTKTKAEAGIDRSWLDPDADWRASVAYLRRYSNYLSPKVGFFSADSWSMGAIWIRNTLLVQLTVVMLIAAVLMIPRLLIGLFTLWPSTGDLRWLSVFFFVVAISGIAGNLLRLNGSQRVWLLRASSWPTSAILASLCLLGALLAARVGEFDPFSNAPMKIGGALGVSSLLVLAGFTAQPLVLKLLSLVWKRVRRDEPPAEINYTQGWAQGLVVAPMMAAGFFLAAVLWGQSVDETHALVKVSKFGEMFRAATLYWPLPLSVAFVSLALLSVVSVKKFSKRSIFWAAFATVASVPVLHALLAAVALLLHHWATVPDQGKWHTFVWAPALVLYVFALTVNVLIGMLSRQSSESVREWWSRLGAWLGIYGFGWMLMTIASIYGPQLGLALLSWEHPWKSLSTVAGWIATTAAGLLAGNSAASGSAKAGGTGKTTLQKVTTVVAMIGPFVFIGGLLIVVSTALHLIVLSVSLPDLPSMGSLSANYWAYLNDAGQMASASTFAAVFVVALVLALRVDINEFSLNAFYRNRLTRCYLGATRRPKQRNPQNFTGFDEDDDLDVAELAAKTGAKAPGPLHLINCALNLGGSSDLALHTRRSAPFTISPYAIGSSYVSSELSGARSPIGYRRTSRYGGRDGQTTLGQAISVSGAAASPNMGYHTSAVVAFLLTLFNVRLGWWFPSPARAISTSSSPWLSLRYLLMELFGGADDKSRYLMISDGGHFENLAAYELVRRKCRVIVVSDAECDPDLHFGSLGSLIRMCEVDFGTRIVIDLSAINDGETSRSRQNFAIGEVIYGDAPDGVLIYLKASMTESGDSAVRQYKASHPTFPHESTGDQFYGEDQFESYRRLGREVADRTFGTFESQPAGTTFVAFARTLQNPEAS